MEAWEALERRRVSAGAGDTSVEGEEGGGRMMFRNGMRWSGGEGTEDIRGESPLRRGEADPDSIAVQNGFFGISIEALPVFV